MDNLYLFQISSIKASQSQNLGGRIATKGTKASKEKGTEVYDLKPEKLEPKHRIKKLCRFSEDINTEWRDERSLMRCYC